MSGLETETAQNNSARARYVTDEVQRYGQIYKQLIQDQLLIEDSFKSKQCKVNLKLMARGAKTAVVNKVTILQGDAALCAAAKRAIESVGLFPLPEDAPDIADKLKSINLTVEPE